MKPWKGLQCKPPTSEEDHRTRNQLYMDLDRFWLISLLLETLLKHIPSRLVQRRRNPIILAVILAHDHKCIHSPRTLAKRLYMVECQRPRRVRSALTRRRLSMHDRSAKVHGLGEVGFRPVRKGHQKGVWIAEHEQGVRTVG